MQNKMQHDLRERLVPTHQKGFPLQAERGSFFAVDARHPAASIVTTAPRRASILISSGRAVISFDFSSAFTCPIAIFSSDEYALTMHGCLPSSPCALRRHLPSRWIVSPAGAAAKADDEVPGGLRHDGGGTLQGRRL